MLTKYFKFKLNHKEFNEKTNALIQNLKDKKILLYGNVEGFKELDKHFGLTKSLNIIAFAKTDKNKNPKGYSIKVINPIDIKNEMFDAIVVMSEDSINAYNHLFFDLGIENIDIYCLFNEEIKEARQNLTYLLEHEFDKTFPKLIKKLKNKRIVLYGAGILFQAMKKYFDFDGLNVKYITDMTFKDTSTNTNFLGYPTCKAQELDKMDIDYVLVTTKRYYEVWEHLYFDFLEKTKIKIKPIFRKTLLEKILEIAE